MTAPRCYAFQLKINPLCNKSQGSSSGQDINKLLCKKLSKDLRRSEESNHNAICKASANHQKQGVKKAQREPGLFYFPSTRTIKDKKWFKLV